MKKIAVVVAIIALVLVGSVFLLPLALSSDTMRTALARQLSEVSGTEIAFNGPIHFSAVPDFGIVIEDMSFATGDGAVSVTAARSVASVELMSLFSSQVRITGIALESPRIVLGEAVATATEPVPVEVAGGDIFKTVAGYLERLSIDEVVVSDGEVATSKGGVLEPTASGIALRLVVPGIDKPASLAVSGTVNGNGVDLAADIGSLRALLERQPAEFSLAAKMEQPPHPLLADVKASGSIQLADDGSYSIAGGEIDSGGQKMRLDVSYAPGDRPFVMARIVAGVLDYSDFQRPETGEVASGDAAAGASGGVDLSALRGMDADIELRAEALQAGDAVARDVVIAAQLTNGVLNSSVQSAQIAGGSLGVTVAADLNLDVPQTSGSLDLASIDIDELMALAGQSVPVAGRLSSQLQYVFLGTDVEAIRNSVNMKGTVSVAGGRVQVPQLSAVAGPGAGVIDALEATVAIEDVRQPLSLSGTAQWNGEALGFATSLALVDLLWGQKGDVAVDVKSQPLNVNFSGTIDPAGAVSGKADISAASLSRALAWMGQATGTSLGRFSFSGGLAASSSEVALSEAAIGLDDMAATGSVSVALSGKPKITAALAVDALDFGKLTGGGGASAQAASSGPTPIDLAVLRLFDADVRLSANQIGYGEVKAGPATASLTVAGGIAEISVPQAGFYDGTVTARVTANGAGDVPAIDFVAAMEGVEALPLLTTAAGFQHIEGKLKASVEVKGAGANTEAFTRSLTGPVNVVFTNGALRGIDVAGLLRNVQSLIGGGYAANSEAKTEFTELSVAADIQNGVGTIADIRLLGPLVRMSGQGTVDLVAQTIEMRLDPRVVASLDGQGSAFDVSGLGMPIIISGPLSQPRIYPDLSNILADPGRALQAISQLGGGLGELANGASGALGGLGTAIGGSPESVADGVINDLLGKLGGGQSGDGAGGTPPANQDLVNSLLGGMLGTQAPGALPPVEAPAPGAQAPVETVEVPTAPVQVAPQNIPLPRMDPRGRAPVVPAPVPEPEAPPAAVDVSVEGELPPAPAEGDPMDLINNLIEQTGL